MAVSQDTAIFLMRYIQAENHCQSTRFPLSLDEIIPDDHLVRVIEAYISISLLDLEQLGFDKSRPKATGCPSYNPADLLKLYLYGYFQLIRSSRRLEAECQRNVEVIKLAIATRRVIQADHLHPNNIGDMASFPNADPSSSASRQSRPTRPQ